MEPQGQNAQLAGKRWRAGQIGRLIGQDCFLEPMSGPRPKASLRWTFRVIGGQP